MGEGSELLLLKEKWWKRSASANVAGLFPKAVWGPQFSHHSRMKAWVTVQVPMTCRCNTNDTLPRCSFVVPEVSASVIKWNLLINKQESSVLNEIIPRRRQSFYRLGVEVLSVLLQSKGAGLLYSSQHLLVQHWEGWVRWQVQAVKTGVSSAGTTGGHLSSAASWTAIVLLKDWDSSVYSYSSLGLLPFHFVVLFWKEMNLGV